MTHIVCPHCDSVNRVPPERLAAHPQCGKCHSKLFNKQPAALTGSRLERHIQRNDIPVVTDFWAAWCGPCKMMEPIFAQACAKLEPRIRFAKVDTESDQEIAMKYGIRGIPTMILFKNGSEADRVSGAMDFANLLSWINTHM